MGARGLVSPGVSGVLIRCIALLLLVLAAGCTESGVRPYSGTWEYHYGRSPAGEGGALLWSLPQQAWPDKGRDYREGWGVAPGPYTPPGRNRQDQLWLRTRLSGPVLREPVLAMQAADERCQAFLDGRELPCFGSFDERALRIYPGKEQVFLPLGADYAGKTLVLRFYSPYQSIGVYGSLVLGEQKAVLVEVVQLGVPVFVVAIILIALGVGVLCLFAMRRSEIDYLQFAGLSLTVGIYLLCRSPMRSLLIDAPLGWRLLELVTFALMGTLLGWFVARMVGDTRLGLLRLQAWLMLLYSLIAAALIGAGTIHIESGLRGLQLLWGFLLITVIALSVIGAMRGSSDARVLGLGILLGGLLASYELLMTLGFLPRTAFLVPHAIGVLILTQGVLLARRFLAIHKRLGDYSSVLQLSFTAVSDPEPGQHSHIALREIVRVLECERALLFLPNPTSGELEISAQHVADGASVQAGPADAPVYDRSLVDLVQRQLRPLFREPSATSLKARRGIMAAPLLARGTTLGVLYLEATPGRRAFTREDAELLSGLGNQLVLLQMIARAVRLEIEGAQARQRLTEQSELLAAAGRMAKGDLMTPISVPAQSNLAVLAQALDEMRQDLLRQIRTLEANNLEIRELNEELRRQIEQRSRRLMEIVLKMEHAPRSAATAFQPGQILGEHYRIVGLIGQGASGQVFEVERTTDGRHLAAKVLSGRADQVSVVRFAREAQILARVSHPNLVAIMDVDLTTAGVLFIVMERVRGTPLHRLTDRYGALGFVLPVLRQIASALQVVHAQGIVHRDLKPANVVIAEESGGPQAKLLDFGVASLADPRGGQAAQGAKPAAGGQSEVGVLLGTPMYLAPELAEGSHLASPASDIFSFGVIAFELMTRFLPFAQPPVVTRYRKERLAVSALLKVRPDLAQAFAARGQALRVTGLIERCLSEDTAARPSAGEIASVLG